MGNEYRDKAWLKEKYIDEGRPMHEISDICDCTGSTISYWIDKHDLPRRSRSESLRRAHGTNEGKYNDPEWLREQYVEEERSAIDIADECGVHFDTIYSRLEEHGIDRRTIKEATNASDDMGFEGRGHPAWREYVSFYTHPRDNYEIWKHNYDNEQHNVFVHRLLAVAEYGFGAVADNVTHHVNGIKWDNRPENIEVMSQEEHIDIHKAQGDYRKT